MLENVLDFFKHFPEINSAIGAGLLIFARFLGFIKIAPGFSRKEMPILVNVSMAFLLAIVFVGVLNPSKPPEDASLIISVMLNVTAGVLIGFIAQCIFAVISAAGDTMNMQMGLSSSMMFDPSTKSQSSIMGVFFSLFGLLIFIDIGGLYWLIAAFQRSFEIFPIYNTAIPLQKLLSMDYLTLITGNVLYIGLQIAAPILVATLGQDIILGIISKTAPQVNVFQLSFLFKPVMGVAILLFIMPILMNVISDHFSYFSNIF